MLNILGRLLVFWGSLGSKQMCMGLFHEIDMPEELKNTEF